MGPTLTLDKAVESNRRVAVKSGALIASFDAHLHSGSFDGF